MLVDGAQRPGTNMHAHGHVAASDRCISMPRTYLKGFGVRTRGHAHKHAMDVLKSVWMNDSGSPLRVAKMARICCNQIHCTARLCFRTFPQEPMMPCYFFQQVGNNGLR